ncbi:hypothetical protein CDAR_603391 [Caerostris darwini]|uniref:Uncharacterized protein n=1 Tax=Caerostris darwini TaxID=1538125 RepID=A0AAV4SQ49_9ARAC|nr:hypothetical protein CDAR_603391 [Caerostris darwini]
MFRVDLPTSTPTLRMDVDIIECRFLSRPDVTLRKVWEAALGMLLTNGLSVMWNSLVKSVCEAHKRNRTKGIPDFRAIRSSLQNLQLDNSRLTQLDNSRLTQLRSDNLKRLKQLQRLPFVNSSIGHVAGDVFRERTCSPYPPPHPIYILFPNSLPPSHTLSSVLTLYK